MSTSPDLGIPYIAASQAQPEVTHNEAVSLLQGLLNGVVDRGVNDPPGSPAEGDAYIIGAAPTGAWAGKANAVAVYLGTAWLFVPGNDSDGDPISMGARQEGMRVWVRDEGLLYAWVGVGSPIVYSWVPVNPDLNADDIDYDNGTSGLAATDVQAAIDEIAASGGGADVSIITPDSATAHAATAANNGGLLIFDSSSDCTLTLPEQSTEALDAGWHMLVKNVGGGNVTIATEGSDVLDGVSLLQNPSQVTTIVLEAVGSPPVNTYSLIGNDWLPAAVEDDALTAPPVTSPPTTPALGAVYIPAATATGAWAGQEDNFAIHVGGDNWEFVAPPDGWTVLEKTTVARITFVPGTGWSAL